LQIVAAGVPSSKLVVGKPVLMEGMANNGMVDPKSLSGWIITARADHSLKFGGGVGGWMWAVGDPKVCQWLNLMGPTAGRKPTNVCNAALPSANNILSPPQ
jgi:hypothetical protein